jgi:predicted nucleotidyltransferase
MALARSLEPGGTKSPRIFWSDRERTRLRLMLDDRILARRYPTKAEGAQVMEQVDYRRREELLGYAHELSEHIVETWNEINPDKPIAVLVYGSIARGLVKAVDAPQVSDIDLTAIGDFTDSERAQLRGNIQGKREEIRDRILADAPGSVEKTDIRYAGAMVQNVTTLTKNGYSDAINYIRSGAFPLYDPTSIWQRIEGEALDFAASRRNKNRAPLMTARELVEEFGDPNKGDHIDPYADISVPIVMIPRQQYSLPNNSVRG